MSDMLDMLDMGIIVDMTLGSVGGCDTVAEAMTERLDIFPPLVSIPGIAESSVAALCRMLCISIVIESIVIESIDMESIDTESIDMESIEVGSINIEPVGVASIESIGVGVGSCGSAATRVSIPNPAPA